MNVIAVSVLSVAAALLCFPATGAAEIYKCKAADGSISYNQNPCAANETTSKILKGARNPYQDRYDCRVAKSFATHVAASMKAGNSSDDLFNEYGGIDTMPSTSVSIVSYVFGHKANTETPISRIVSLSTARCQAGAYSESLDCSNFPVEFIQKIGGCDSAKGEQPAFNTAIPTPQQLPGGSTEDNQNAAGEAENGGRGDESEYAYRGEEGEGRNSGEDGERRSQDGERGDYTAEAEAKALEAQLGAARAAAAAADLNREFEAETDAAAQAKCRATAQARMKSVQEAMRDTSLSAAEHERLDEKRIALRTEYSQC